MKKILFLLFATIVLTGCWTNTSYEKLSRDCDSLYRETNSLITQKDILVKDIEVLRVEKEILNSGATPKYFVVLRTQYQSLEIGHIASTKVAIPVDKEYFDNTHIGQCLCKGSGARISSLKIVVIDKYIK